MVELEALIYLCVVLYHLESSRRHEDTPKAICD